MSLTVTKTVRELALEIANATRVFEKLGIDYCCGGQKSLEEACATINLTSDDVLNQLNHAAEPTVVDSRDWQASPLADLVHQIVTTHHKFVREESARLQ